MSEAAQTLRVDPIRCDGLGYCAELCPELIGLDDWGYPVVDPRPVADETVLRHARRAVSRCPRQALALVTPAPAGRR